MTWNCFMVKRRREYHLPIKLLFCRTESLRSQNPLLINSLKQDKLFFKASNLVHVPFWEYVTIFVNSTPPTISSFIYFFFVSIFFPVTGKGKQLHTFLEEFYFGRMTTFIVAVNLEHIYIYIYIENKKQNKKNTSPKSSFLCFFFLSFFLFFLIFFKNFYRISFVPYDFPKTWLACFIYLINMCLFLSSRAESRICQIESLLSLWLSISFIARTLSLLLSGCIRIFLGWGNGSIFFFFLMFGS